MSVSLIAGFSKKLNKPLLSTIVFVCPSLTVNIPSPGNVFRIPLKATVPTLLIEGLKKKLNEPLVSTIWLLSLPLLIKIPLSPLFSLADNATVSKSLRAYPSKLVNEETLVSAIIVSCPSRLMSMPRPASTGDEKATVPLLLISGSSNTPIGLGLSAIVVVTPSLLVNIPLPIVFRLALKATVPRSLIAGFLENKLKGLFTVSAMVVIS